MNKPLVSICSITYNHAPYIRKCLDGFLMQKTSFPIEILIHDDASTDGTADIIRECQKHYPDIIKPIIQKENRYSRGLPVSELNFERARGKYIALCEGDDYWTDPNKLQIQVDFMESHPDYSMCFHGCETIAENNKLYTLTGFGDFKTGDYTGKDVLANWMVPTASVLLRTEFIDKVPRDKDFWAGDIVVWLTMSKYGKIFGMSKKMSVYRRCESGMTQKLATMEFIKRYRKKRKHLIAIFRHFPFIGKRLYEKLLINLMFQKILLIKAAKGFPYFFRLMTHFSLIFQLRIYFKYLMFRVTRSAAKQ